MGFLNRKRLKRKLGNKLIYSPFIRLVLFNTWFQLAFGAMLLVSIFVALYLPKIWRSSPDHFLPVVKVSGLDMTQNWALKRSARKAVAAGDFHRASRSWEAAVAQDPGDVEAFRGYLSNALKLEKADRNVFRSAISQINWLLRLTQTNSMDVILAAKVCEKFKWHDVSAFFFGNITPPLPPEAEATYLKALFQLGRLEEFQQRYAASAARLQDTEIPLYDLAFKAASSSDPGASQAEYELLRLSESGEHTDIATRLYMLACGQRGNADGYAKSLQKLALRNGDSVMDHAAYWMLLVSRNRSGEAVQLAKAFTRAPGSAYETVRLADAYYQLGLLDDSRALLDKFAPMFPQAPEVWVAYAAVLEKVGDWAGMREIALKIRQEPVGRDTLWGYAYFLEGRAELAEKRLASAERAFEKAAESSYEIPPLGAAVAKELTRLKFPRLSLAIYYSLEKSFEKDARFWEEYFEAAFAAHDPAMTLKTSERCYQLNSADPKAQNRYAAALIVNRERPDEVVKLTFGLITRFPNSSAARLNHTFALLLNGRTEEAQLQLEQVHPERLSPGEMSSYHLASFELNYNLKRWEAAGEASDKIARSTLFATQRIWLDETLKKMPTRQIARSQ